MRTIVVVLALGACRVTARGDCATPPLAAGTWTLEYAGDSLTFEVPGEVSGCLEGL